MFPKISFKKSPHFVSGLEHFEANHNGQYGEIVSSWKRMDNKVIYNITIPANSSATLCLKGKKISGAGTAEKQEDGINKYQLNSGKYEITVEE